MKSTNKGVIDSFLELKPLSQLTIINWLFEQSAFYDADKGEFVPYSTNRAERKQQQIKEFWKLYPNCRKKWEKEKEEGEFIRYEPFGMDWQAERDANKQYYQNLEKRS